MKSRLVTAVIALAGLLAGGAVLQRCVAPAGPPRADGASVLGGWRTLAADLAWLRAYATWEERDPAATETLLELTTALDPAPVYFWLNGARMIAYDLPAWRIGAEGGFRTVAPARQRAIEREQAERALAFLARGRSAHPPTAVFWIEAGNLQLNRLHEIEAAAESYRRAAAERDAPYYAARIYAELLRRLGRKREALAWLEQLYPSLPPYDEAAAAGLVRARIEALRRELAGDMSESRP